jgi:polyisoprenoid-binding protein YceI
MKRLSGFVAFVVIAPSAAVAQAPAGKSGGAAKAPAKAPAAASVRYIVGPTGNEARYRVREQLVGIDLPNDAIGKTSEVAGRIVVAKDGSVVKDSSKIVVQVSSLTSDKPRRDAFIKRSTLETSKYPQVELVPTTLQGLLVPLAPGASKTFTVVGDLTVRGVTHPTTWQVTARAEGKDIVGSAATAFTFADFGMTQPKVPIVLSVADTIRLEYDFHFVPDTAK